MKKKLLSLSLISLVFSTSALADNYKDYRAFDTPVNYNYLQLFFGWGSIDPDSAAIDEENVTALGISYQKMINENWIGEIDYEGRFIHGDAADVRNDRTSVRGKYRVGINEKSDLVFGAKLGVMRSKVTKRSDDSTISSDTDFMYGFGAEYRYGFNKNWEGGLGLEYTDADHLDETAVTADIIYYSSSKFGFGAYLTKLYGSDTETAEGGIKARFRF